MPSSLRGESHPQKLKSVKWIWVTVRWVLMLLHTVSGSGGQMTSPHFPSTVGCLQCGHVTLFLLQRGPGELQRVHADLGSLPADWGQWEEQEPPHQRAAQQPDKQTAVWVKDQRPPRPPAFTIGVCVCVHNISIYVPVAFRLYDLDRDDKISRDELLQVSVCEE